MPQPYKIEDVTMTLRSRRVGPPIRISPSRLNFHPLASELEAGFQPTPRGVYHLGEGRKSHGRSYIYNQISPISTPVPPRTNLEDVSPPANHLQEDTAVHL